MGGRAWRQVDGRQSKAGSRDLCCVSCFSCHTGYRLLRQELGSHDYPCDVLIEIIASVFPELQPHCHTASSCFMQKGSFIAHTIHRSKGKNLGEGRSVDCGQNRSVRVSPCVRVTTSVASSLSVRLSAELAELRLLFAAHLLLTVGSLVTLLLATLL